MVRIQVDLGRLEDYPTNTLPGFTAALLTRLPGLAQHGCSTGKPGGFVERLEEGTWLGHVIEHVALELQSMAGTPVARGKTRSVKGRPGQYNIMYTYKIEEAGRCAGRIALDLVASLLPPKLQNFSGAARVYAMPDAADFDFERSMAMLQDVVNQNKLGPTTQSLVDEAERRRIPWQRLDRHSLIQFGTGKYQKTIRASITGQTAHIAVENAGNKELTKQLLAQAEIPVPSGGVVRSVEDAVKVARRIGFPVAVKPLNGNHGRGVNTNLASAAAVEAAFAHASAHSKSVIVEKHYNGRDYRVLVVNGVVAAAAERMPAHVIGNGRDTIECLIAAVNANPLRGDGHEKVMTRIRVDSALYSWLARTHKTLETVPAAGEHVVLASTANLSTGGTAIDVTDIIHADNVSIARRAALTIGLDIAGIDMILPDITQSWRETGGGIVEVNAAPGFRMHLKPSQGEPRDVARPVLEMLYPKGAKTQVPVVAITGTNGKSTTVRMVAHILRESGLRVGFTSTSGSFINDDVIWQGDASGPKSARLLLRDPTIDVAVLEVARGGMLREGLGFPRCDVGAVLNVTPDHLGLGGIETLDDLAALKSVVTEAVMQRGVSVLNADDPRTFKMARHAGGEICYFSMQPLDQSPLQSHVARGGRGMTRELLNGQHHIVLHQGGTQTPVIAVNDIPATHNGAAGFNVENALAAAAIVCGLNNNAQIIHDGLKGFTSSFEQNPGRINIYDGHGFRVIMDYAHNVAGMEAFFTMLRDMRKNYRRTIGHFNTPGDRDDDTIRTVGQIAGRELDIPVFREMPDNRGRAKGEVIGLLAEGARAAGRRDEEIICVYDEVEATNVCLANARPGDLVILTPTDIKGIWQQMLDFKPNFAIADTKTGTAHG